MRSEAGILRCLQACVMVAAGLEVHMAGRAAKETKVKTKATPEEVAKKGGIARAEALTPERKSDIGKKGALARWGETPVEATHYGVLRIGDIEIPSAVLADGRRVLTQQGVLGAIGRPKVGMKAAGEGVETMPPFLVANNLKPFISADLRRWSTPTRIKTSVGSLAYAYPAEILPEICGAFLDARQAGVLLPSQAHIAARCEILLRGFAKVGITALVDEATGYQEIRDRQALQTILDAFLRKEFAAWAKRFPDEFYEQIFRLRGWTWRGMKVNRPHAVAHYTKDVVYARLAPGILTELETRNPAVDGRRARKHHQFLTDDLGHPALSQHIYAVVGFMRASRTWEQFMDLLNIAFPKRGDTLSFEFMVPVKALPGK